MASDDDVFEGLFESLNERLERMVDLQFFKEPNRFKSILEVIDVVGQSPIQLPPGVADDPNFSGTLRQISSGYARLLDEKAVVGSVIEEVVRLQHGGLNSSIECMGDVISNYKKSQELLAGFRASFVDIKSVLSPTKQGQATLRELWERKRLLENQLRMLDEFETLFDAPGKIQRLNSQKKYMTAVKLLNTSITSMHGEDMLAIGALDNVRSTIMDLKERLIDSIVVALRDIILSLTEVRKDLEQTDFDDAGSVSEFESDNRSEVTKSVVTDATASGGTVGPMSKAAEALHSTAWPLSLLDVSESVEEGAGDVTSSVSVYIRLLIRASNGLNCEDDVQRMVLDLKPESFTTITNKIRAIILTKKYSQKLDEKALTKRFHLYMTSVLTSAFLMLKKILYINRLVRISKNQNEPESKTAIEPSESTRNMILSLWNSIEDAIVDMMTKHFVEADVQEISNDVKGVATKKSPKKIIHHDVFSDEYDFDIGLDALGETVCPPTVKLAAGVYKDIAGFTERVIALFRDEMDPEVSAERVSNVLKKEQEIVEGELMPVVQSIVNKEVRDMLLNGSQFFSTLSGAHNAELENASKVLVERINFEVSGDDSSSFQQQEQQQHERKTSDLHADDIRVCLASMSCLKTTRPLLNYWRHLPMHRDYLVTILERFLDGYTASARQETENICWKMLSMDKKYNTPILESVTADPFFVYYRNSVYEGKSTVEDLMASLRQKMTANDPIFPQDMMSWATFEAGSREFSCWEEFWDVSLTTYKVTNQVITKDFQKVQVIAAIAYGCDWLALKLSKLFHSTSRKFNSAGVEKLSSSSSIFAPRAGKSIQISATAALESISTLRKVFQNGVMDLSILAKECICVLRGELQVACFHFLHLVSKLDFSSSVKDGADGRPEPEALIAAWNQYILSFQDALLVASHPSLLAVVFSPIARLAPRLLMRCVKSLYDSMTVRTAAEGGEYKTKLLRAILACQQGLAMLFESSRQDASANRTLQEILSAEFSKLRRYVQLLGCLTSELRIFISSNNKEYSKAEFKTLWMHTTDKGAHDALQDFSGFWKTTKVFSSSEIPEELRDTTSAVEYSMNN